MHLYACSITTVVIQIPISHVLFFLVTRSVHNYFYGLAWLIHHISKRQLINLSIYLNFLPLRVLPLLSPYPSSFFPSQIHPRISETFVMVLLKRFHIFHTLIMSKTITYANLKIAKIIIIVKIFRCLTSLSMLFILIKPLDFFPDSCFLTLDIP